MVGLTPYEFEGILYKLKRRLRKELPKECYEIVKKEFQKVEAYLEEKKAEIVEI